MSSEWWLDGPGEEFDQGDIFEGIPFLETVIPLEPLTGADVRGGIKGWVPAKHMPEVGTTSKWLSQGRISRGILLNHGCDLDKPNTKRCILAVVAPIGALPPDQHDNVKGQRSIPLMYLPGVPVIGDCFADLRVTASVPRELINKAPRVASMTEAARDRLMVQFIRFFTRRDLNSFTAG